MKFQRNPYAYQANFKNSAGPMKHKCEGRSGARNSFAEYMEEYTALEAPECPTEDLINIVSASLEDIPKLP